MYVHMNATQWETLTGFVKWLWHEGKCVMDEIEKGWFISYIDRNLEVIWQREALVKKMKMEKDDEEDTVHFIQKQTAQGEVPYRHFIKFFCKFLNFFQRFI